MKPAPVLTAETFELWNWDVAEVFIGADFQNMGRYKEFEVSPQGEWVDLDIDLDSPNPQQGWAWKSGCEVAARIDAARNLWYGFMRIPWQAIDESNAFVGKELRVNFFRCEGVGAERKLITWQPTFKPTFHAPEAFGILELAGRK